MSNLPALAVKLPHPTPCATLSMSRDECADHRAKIAFEVEVILQGYWQTELAPEMKAAVLADWADELEDWHLEQVRWGLREWRRANPRRKPNAADVLAILKAERGRAEMARLAAQRSQQPTEDREPISADRANAILAELGFAVKRIEPPKERATEAEIQAATEGLNIEAAE